MDERNDETPSPLLNTLESQESLKNMMRQGTLLLHANSLSDKEDYVQSPISRNQEDQTETLSLQKSTTNIKKETVMLTGEKL